MKLIIVTALVAGVAACGGGGMSAGPSPFVPGAAIPSPSIPTPSGQMSPTPSPTPFVTFSPSPMPTMSIRSHHRRKIPS